MGSPLHQAMASSLSTSSAFAVDAHATFLRTTTASRKLGFHLLGRGHTRVQFRLPRACESKSRGDGEGRSRSSPSPFVPYGWIAGLASTETLYLTFTRFSGESLACPFGGSACVDVLNSDHASIIGIPPLDVYCITSAILSLGLILSTLWVQGLFSPLPIIANAWMQRFSSRGLKQVVIVAASVIFALSTAYGNVDSALAGSSAIDIPPVEPEVTTLSSPMKVSLAKHLKSIGAKMYGAFWCSHCYQQKQMFGNEAMKFVDYVECYPDGYRAGVQLAKACTAAKIEGFPTWVIKGEAFPGEQKLAELARISGFPNFEPSSLLE